ncbi:MAG: response regulator [Pontixanthobacter sp.]
MAQRAPKRVLLIEDDAVLSLWIEDILRETGTTRITHCVSTSDAMKALRRKLPELIILDVHLADRDDGWAIAELAAMIGPKPPRIVFSTGSPQDIPEDIAKLGTVLEKPYDRDVFVAATRIGRKGLLDNFAAARA